MRTNNSIKNIIFSLTSQFFTFLLSFINRSVFIQQLGVNYLGVSGLFSNILSMLSLAELGIGSAITYSLYKPIAENDKKKISALMNLYADAYKIIGMFVAVIGISLVPFLDYLIKDKPDIPNLNIIYLLYLLNSVVSYFFAYKRTIIVADQKGYINTINQFKFSSISTIVQILLLLTTKNFLLYLITSIVFNIISNIVISKKADKLYPFLKNGKEEYLSNQEKKSILKYVLAAMSHKFGAVVVFGTDNLLLSSFIGVYWVGIYSNYTLLIGVIQTLIAQIFSSILASVGNLNATVEEEKSYNVYQIIYFINFWIYGFSAIALMVLLNPFINIWLGSNFILNNVIVFVIVLNFFIGGMRSCTTTYNTTLGLFWNDRFKPWFEAGINLIASIILLKIFGFIGVLLGTFISTITTSFWIEPYILFKHGFKKPLKKYFNKYVLYIICLMFTGGLTKILCDLFTDMSLLGFLGKVILVAIIPNVIFLMVFYKKYEFKEIKKIIIRISKYENIKKLLKIN